jgi:helicase domain protein
MNAIVPDEHGDWFNQRDDSFSHFMRLDGKKTRELAIFKNFSLGVATGRDAWCYNFNKKALSSNIHRLIDNYENIRIESISNKNFVLTKSPTEISWNSNLEQRLKQKVQITFTNEAFCKSHYRPFITSNLYFHVDLIARRYQLASIFPTKSSKNLVICSSGVGAKEYSCLMVNHIPCLDFLEKTQCFPRWLPGDQGKTAEDELDFGESSELPSGFSPQALPHFQAAYPGKPITEDDLFYYIYGILHSEDYRTRYANNLMKELPRIPRAATYEQFMAFVEAGQELAKVHVHFEDVKPYGGVTIEYTKSGQPSYRVKQMKWGKIKGKTGNAAKDKTTLIYNDWITVKNIPLEAQEYVVNKKSALDWVVERACVSIDKASGIVNDFNDYASEMGSERYPLDLFLKIITVSLKTMRIVRALPKLEIHALDK